MQLCSKIISFLCGWSPARCRDRIDDVARRLNVLRFSWELNWIECKFTSEHGKEDSKYVHFLHA